MSKRICSAVLSGLGGLFFSAGAPAATPLTSASEKIALNVSESRVAVDVFHYKADGVRCGIRLVSDVPGENPSRFIERLLIVQDEKPLAAKDLDDTDFGGIAGEVSFNFEREVLFISKVEVRTKSGRSLDDELGGSKVSVAARDCEPPREGPVMVARER